MTLIFLFFIPRQKKREKRQHTFLSTFSQRHIEGNEMTFFLFSFLNYYKKVKPTNSSPSRGGALGLVVSGALPIVLTVPDPQGEKAGRTGEGTGGNDVMGGA